METEENQHSIQKVPSVIEEVTATTSIDTRARVLPDARNPAVLYLASLRATGRRSQASALARLTTFLGGEDPRTMPWERLAYGHAKRLAAWLRDDAGFKPATRKRYWSALRGVLREADALGLMAPGEWSRIRDLRGRFGKSAEAGRALSDFELAKLLALGGRIAAVIALGALAGLRREEIAGLDVKGIGIGEDGLPAVTVSGKGGKERIVPIGSRAHEAVRGWVRIVVATRPEVAGPLFPGRHGRISLTGLTNLLANAAKAAGIATFTPHDLRRTYITGLLERGNDLAVVSKLAGHEQIETTKRYDKRGAPAKRKAADTLDKEMT